MSLKLKGKITVELNFLRSKNKRFIFFSFSYLMLMTQIIIFPSFAKSNNKTVQKLFIKAILNQ